MIAALGGSMVSDDFEEEGLPSGFMFNDDGDIVPDDRLPDLNDEDDFDGSDDDLYDCED